MTPESEIMKSVMGAPPPDAITPPKTPRGPKTQPAYTIDDLQSAMRRNGWQEPDIVKGSAIGWHEGAQGRAGANRRASASENAALTGGRGLSEDSVGPFQINWQAHAPWIQKEFGYNRDDLFDIDKNAQVAAALRYGGPGRKPAGWSPWKLANEKFHQQYLPLARSAYAKSDTSRTVSAPSDNLDDQIAAAEKDVAAKKAAVDSAGEAYRQAATSPQSLLAAGTISNSQSDQNPADNTLVAAPPALSVGDVQEPRQQPQQPESSTQAVPPSVLTDRNREAITRPRLAASLPAPLVDVTQPSQQVYETPLTPQEEIQFQTWKQRYAPNDTGADYDLRGAFKSGLRPDPRTGHWPDTFKKPNHPTFSNESQYAVGEDAQRAGRWEGDKFIPPASVQPEITAHPEDQEFGGMTPQEKTAYAAAQSKPSAIDEMSAQMMSRRGEQYKAEVDRAFGPGLWEQMQDPQKRDAAISMVEGAHGLNTAREIQTFLQAQDAAKVQSVLGTKAATRLNAASPWEKNRIVAQADNTIQQRKRRQQEAQKQRNAQIEEGRAQMIKEADEASKNADPDLAAKIKAQAITAKPSDVIAYFRNKRGMEGSTLSLNPQPTPLDNLVARKSARTRQGFAPVALSESAISASYDPQREAIRSQVISEGIGAPTPTTLNRTGARPNTAAPDAINREVEHRVAEQNEAVAERKRLFDQMTPEAKDAFQKQVSSYIGQILESGSGKGVQMGWRDFRAQSYRLAAGLMDVASKIPGDSDRERQMADYLRKQAMAMEDATAKVNEAAPLSAKQQAAQHVVNLAGGLVLNSPAMVTNPVAGFAALSALQARGKNLSLAETIKESAIGAGTGLVFEGAAKFLPPASGSFADTAKALGKQSAAIGAGTAAVELAAGRSPGQAASAAAQNVFLHGIFRAPELTDIGLTEGGNRIAASDLPENLRSAGARVAGKEPIIAKKAGESEYGSVFLDPEAEARAQAINKAAARAYRDGDAERGDELAAEARKVREDHIVKPLTTAEATNIGNRRVVEMPATEFDDMMRRAGYGQPEGTIGKEPGQPETGRLKGKGGEEPPVESAPAPVQPKPQAPEGGSGSELGTAYNEDDSISLKRYPWVRGPKYDDSHTVTVQGDGESSKITPYQLSESHIRTLEKSGENPSDFIAAVFPDGSRSLIHRSQIQYPESEGKTDAVETGQGQKDDQQQYQGISPGTDVPANAGQVREGDSGQAGSRGGTVKFPSTPKKEKAPAGLSQPESTAGLRGEDVAQTPQQIIEAEGYKYLGEQQRPKGKSPLHMFNDDTGSTLTLETVTPESVRDKVAQSKEQRRLTKPPKSTFVDTGENLDDIFDEFQGEKPTAPFDIMDIATGVKQAAPPPSNLPRDEKGLRRNLKAADDEIKKLRQGMPVAEDMAMNDRGASLDRLNKKIDEAVAKRTEIAKALQSLAKPQPKQPVTAKAPENLPQHLAGAKPRYNYGNKAFELDFASDLDRAAYITAQKTPSKSDSEYMRWARIKTGMSEPEVRAHGQRVKDAIKEMASTAEPGRLQVPEQPRGRQSTTGLTEGMGNAGKAIAENLYRGMFDRMEQGKLPAPFPADKQPAFERFAKQEYDAGRVKSWETLRDMAQTFDAKPQPNVKGALSERGSKLEPKGNKARSFVGKNSDGEDIFEDQNGVRSILDNNIHITEPVGLRPTRGGVEVLKHEHQDRYLTKDELKSKQHPYITGATKTAGSEVKPVDVEQLRARALELSNQIRGAERIAPSNAPAIRKIQEDSLARNKSELDDLRVKLRQAEKGITDKPNITGAIKTAGSEAKAGLDESIRAIESILKDVGKSQMPRMGPAFDEKTYENLKPHLIAATKHFYKAGMSLADALRALLQHLENVVKWSKEQIAQLRPYIMRFMADLKSGDINLEGEETSTVDSGAPSQSESKPPESEFVPFAPELESLGIPRAAMPQVRNAHRGAMTQFLQGRGIELTAEEAKPSDLKPTQSDYNPSKVAESRQRAIENPDKEPRKILVSSDNYVIDGHHQWKRDLEDEPNTPIPVLRLHAPAQTVMLELARFPSSYESGKHESTAETDYGTIEKPNVPNIARYIADQFAQGAEYRTIVQARSEIGNQLLGGNIEPGTQAAKQVDEAVELGVVTRAREIVQQVISDGEEHGVRVEPETYYALRKLYNQQPNLAVKTSTSVQNQAYSTPIPLAYIASRLAGIDENTFVYEPTAGNGALLIEANPDNVWANELDPDRRKNLAAQGFTVSPEDATTFLPDPTEREGDTKEDVVIANPPFGVVKEGGQSKTFQITPQYSTTQIDHAIAFKSLEAMKDDGSAVLIVGGVKAEDETERAKGYSGSDKRGFYYELYQQYNVVDHFTVNGDLYKKQGAGWPVDVIVIHGRGKSSRKLPAADVPRIYNSWDQLEGVLNEPYRELLDARRAEQYGEREPRGSMQGGSDQGIRGPKSRPGSLPEPVDESAAGTLGSSGRGGKPVHGGQSVSGPRGSGSSGTGLEPGQTGSDIIGTKPATTPEPVGRPGISAGDDAEEQSAGGTDLQGNGPRELGGQPTRTPTKRRPVEAIDITKAQAPYKPASQKGAPLNTLVPINMKSSIERALADIVAKYGDIDEFVAKEIGYKADEIGKYLSAEQVDGIALAIDNIRRDSEVIIGDQGGIGKGRIAAAILWWAIQQKRPVIFVTHAPDLFKDIVRDLVNIGKGQREDWAKWALMTNNSKSVALVDDGEVLMRTPDAGRHNARLADMREKNSLGKHKVIFTTYSQMQNVKDRSTGVVGPTERQRFLRHFSQDAIIVFDESHNAGGQGEKRETKKQKQAKAAFGADYVDDRAKFARDIIGRAQGVVALSATYAKHPQVMDLYSKTDMRLAFKDPKQIGKTLAKGGVPLQQVTASMLAEARQMIRRERDMSGLEFTAKILPVDRVLANNVANAMQQIREFDDAKNAKVSDLDDQLQETGSVRGMDIAISGAGMSSTTFTSLLHNALADMAMMLKVDGVAQEAIESIKAGRKPVIAVAKTMGAFIEHFAAENDLKAGDAVDLDFSHVLHRYLERSREVVIKGPHGERERRYLTDEQLGPRGLALYNKAKDFINSIDFSSMPMSPIDYIKAKVQEAGYTIGEITGREHAIRYQPKMKRAGEGVSTAGGIEPVAQLRLDKEKIAKQLKELKTSPETVQEIGSLRRRLRDIDVMLKGPDERKAKANQMFFDSYYYRRPTTERSTNGRNKTIVDFNKNRVDALIINESGSTGISLHASTDFLPAAQTRQREMLIAQPHLNIDTFMQTLWRIDRTGQIIKPTYKLLSGDIPAEIRPSAVLMRKMASLNANTTAAKGGAYESKDMPDFMNLYGDRVAADVMWEHQDIRQRLGVRLSEKPNGGYEPENAMAKVTGRIPLLPLVEQEQLYDLLANEYKGLIERLDAMGENQLEAKTLDLGAKQIDRTEIFAGSGDDSPFARSAQAETMEVKKVGKPFTSEQVIEQIEKTLKASDATVKDRPAKTRPAKMLHQTKVGPLYETDSVHLWGLGTLSNVTRVYWHSGSGYYRAVGTDILGNLEEWPLAEPDEITPGSRIVEVTPRTVANSGKTGLAALEERGAAQIQDLIDDTTERMNDYIRSVVDEIEKEEKQQVQETKLRGNLQDWINAIEELPVGRAVQFEIGDGDEISYTRGIVTKVEQRGKPKSPVAMGSWKVTIAVPDATRHITIPLSQIHGVEGVGKTLARVEGRMQQVPILEAFDHGQSDVREDRVIMTGNLLAAYDKFPKGRIINFTDEHGAVQQGILMAQDFNLAREMDKQAVTFTNPDHVIRFLEQKRGERLVNTPDGNLRITMDRSGDIHIATEVSKAKGGMYYLNPQILAALRPREFVKSGKNMVVDMDPREAPAVINAIRAAGFTLQTDSFKESAREITGEKKPEKETTDTRGQGYLTDKGMTKPGSEAGAVNLSEIAKGLRGILDLPSRESRQQIQPVLDRMAEQHRQVRGAEFEAARLTRKVADMIKDMPVDEQTAIIDAMEHKYEGPFWDILSPEQQAVADSLKPIHDMIERYNHRHQVFSEKEMPDDLRHLFHWWNDPKTGRPFQTQYGEFARTGPSSRQRSIESYQQGRDDNGLEMASTNPGEILGQTLIQLIQVKEARQLVAVLKRWRLNDPAGPKLRGIVSEIPKGFEDRYEKINIPPLKRRRYIPVEGGPGMLIQQPTYALKEIAPVLNAYFVKPDWSKLDEVFFAMKSIKLSLSFFHGLGLFWKNMTMFRFRNIHDIREGLKEMHEMDDTMKRLYQNGLETALKNEYEDINAAYGHFHRKSWIGRAMDLSHKNPMTNLIFNVVRVGLKNSYAYHAYERMVQRYIDAAERENGGLLNPKQLEAAKNRAARDVVNRASSLFSGEDMRWGAIEAADLTNKLYFSPRARRIWDKALISKTWQREHLIEAKNIVKSALMPKTMGPIRREYYKQLAGAVFLLAIADLTNWFMTRFMDGKGTHMWNNPTGSIFSVRLPWNEPAYPTNFVTHTGHLKLPETETRVVKGAPAFVRPFKAITEVPEMLMAIYHTVSGNTGAAKRDIVELVSAKLHPIWQALADQMTFDKQKRKQGEVERLKAVAGDMAPIAGDTPAQVIRGRRNPFDLIPWTVGAPVTKGQSDASTLTPRRRR